MANYIDVGNSTNFYQRIELNGVPLASENTLNFTGDNITVVDDPDNSSTDVSISATVSAIAWYVRTVDSPLGYGTGQFANGSGALNFALPATAIVGQEFQVADLAGFGFNVTQGDGQYIIFNSATTTVGATGSIASSILGANLTLVCCVADVGFMVISSLGNFVVN